MKKQFLFTVTLVFAALFTGQNAFAEYCKTAQTTTRTTGDRYLSSFTMGDGTNTVSVTGLQTNTSRGSCYFDKTVSVLTVSAGATITPTVNWHGEWMHGYIWVDYNKNQIFEKDLETTGVPKATSELVSYTFLERPNRNSKGLITTTDNPDYQLPSKLSELPFNIPADLAVGDYRARLVIEWASDDPCGTNNMGSTGGAMVDFTIRIIASSERTVTISSSDIGKGSVSIDGESGLSVRKAGPITLIATPESGFCFVNWTNGVGGAVVSTASRFIQNGNEDITLVANFSSIVYPVMKRTFTGNAMQENRYIKSVTTSGTATPTVFSCATQSELPYTAFTATGGTYVTAGALLDKTATPIVIDQGTTSFNMIFFAWQNAIGSALKEIDWTQNAYFIDWNRNGRFTDAGEISAKSGDAEQNTALYNVGGYSRTINIPVGQASGNYRMRVVFYEPSPNTEQWQNTLFSTKNNEIRNGISYDFIIQVLDPTDMKIIGASVSKNSGRINPGDKNIILGSVNVKTSGSLNPLALKDLKMQYSGTTTGDINNLRWVYSTSGNVTGDIVSSAANALSNMTFSVNKQLTLGNNFFILIADVANAAVVGNKIQVAVNSATVADNSYTLETPPGVGEYIVSKVVDYTKGNAVWFDTPNSSTAGAEIWKTNDTSIEENWERRSYPIGNGSFGGNILGSINRERIVLNEKTLWKGGPGTGAAAYWDMNKTVSSSVLDNIRNYLVNGQNSNADNLVMRNFNGKIDYNKNKFGAFTV
ncbi:MAG: GEVED domain-containing protein, partial [Bacteroidales bacterium]